MDVDLPIDRVEGCVESIDMLHVQPQQKAVMIGHPATQRFAQQNASGFSRRPVGDGGLFLPLVGNKPAF